MMPLAMPTVESIAGFDVTTSIDGAEILVGRKLKELLRSKVRYGLAHGDFNDLCSYETCTMKDAVSYEKIVPMVPKIHA